MNCYDTSQDSRNKTYLNSSKHIDQSFICIRQKECVYSYLWKSISQLRSVTCRMGSHSVTFHPTQANTPRFYPSQSGWYSIYRPFKDGGEPRVQRATGPRLLRDSPEPARPEPTIYRSLVEHVNHWAIAPGKSP